MRAPLLLLCVAACASERAGTTWEDDRRDGVARAGRDEAPAEPPPTPSPRGVEPAAIPDEELELALIRFTARRRALFDTPPAPAWPRPMLAAFADTLDVLEQGLTRPKGQVARRLLVQARVSMEVELDLVRARYGEAPPVILERIGRLFGVIALHMSAAPPLAGARPRPAGAVALSWPVSPVIVTSFYGYRRDPILGKESVRFHAGVDLGGAQGDVVSASAEGRVVQAGWVGGHGRTVVVQHAGGYQTFYAHLKQILVPIGALVRDGDALGLMGSSGRSTGPHLHFEVRQGAVPVDPLDVMREVYAGDPSTVVVGQGGAE